MNTVCDRGRWSVLLLVGICSQHFVSPGARAAETPEWLRTALTFCASFDQGADADWGKGDRRLFSAPSLEARKSGKPGLPETGAVSVVQGAGRFGDALRFHRTGPEVVFFQVDRNLPYPKSNWSGAISFWLKVSPDKDLRPGYCDPLFITPRVFNDAALWVDFSDKAPRNLRHGAFPDRKVWDPELRDFDKIPVNVLPLLTVSRPPFSSETWTQIVVSFANFNTGNPDGISKLYLNGKLAGRVGPREQTFTWEPGHATAVLGINYLGLFDELAFFNRALLASEIEELFALPAGLGGSFGSGPGE